MLKEWTLYSLGSIGCSLWLYTGDYKLSFWRYFNLLLYDFILCFPLTRDLKLFPPKPLMLPFPGFGWSAWLAQWLNEFMRLELTSRSAFGRASMPEGDPSKKEESGVSMVIKSGEHCVPDHILEVDNAPWCVKALWCLIGRELFHVLQPSISITYLTGGHFYDTSWSFHAT